MQLLDLVPKMKAWAATLGFTNLRITDVDLSGRKQRLERWLEQGYHGQMSYLSRNEHKRAHPQALVEGTTTIISLQMPYLQTVGTHFLKNELQQGLLPQKARVSLYARGRDYHRVIRSRLQKLVDMMQTDIGPFQYRVFTDSAPVMEVELAEKAGIGWRGKNGLLIDRTCGSFFFLGEIFVNLPLPVDDIKSFKHCGNCTQCMSACPTHAIIEPYVIDARRCISYLTIELDGPIPVHLRPLIGNRIYGCDECQLCCPWNRFAQQTSLTDFSERNDFSNITLLSLLSWDEAMFLEKTQGTAIRRIGYDKWVSNIAIALGNTLRTEISADDKQAIIKALLSKKQFCAEWVFESIQWAVDQGSY